MIGPSRRSVIAGALASIAGSAVASVGAGDESSGERTGADPDGIRTNSNGSTDDGRLDDPATEVGDEAALDGSDDESTGETGGELDGGDATPPLELSVSVPETVPVPEGRAELLITVANCGEETRSTPIAIEVGCVEDDLETPTLAPGESAETYASYAGTRLGRGTHEWTVAVGAACERGTLSVT